MKTFNAFIKRHPLSTYFVLTFIISWGGILLVIGGPGAIPSPSEKALKMLPTAILVMIAGPSISGILLTGLIYGRTGFRDFLSHLFNWRVRGRWYAVALLTAPLLILATLFALLPTSRVFLPGIFASDNKLSLLLGGLAAGLGAGVFEETGWTGFAVPRIRVRYGVLATGLIVGFLWGAWHFLVTFWGSGDSSGALSLDLLFPPLLFYVGVLPVYRVLMVWVYDRTASLLVIMLMHAALTASAPMILTPLEISGVPLMTWYLVLTAVLWVVVAMVRRANGEKLSRQPLSRGLN